MRPVVYGAFWIAIALVLVMAPLLVLLAGATPPGRGFWREFSVGLAFVGLSMMGLQFFLTGRFRRISFPYGIDIIYHFHRQISLVAFLLLSVHIAVLFVSSPAMLAFLNPLNGPGYIQAAWGSFGAFALLILTTLYRKTVRLRYEPWRLLHGALAVVAVALALWHIAGVGYYVQAPLARGLWIGLAVSWLAALVHVRLVRPVRMLRSPYTVDEVVRERGDTWTLALKPNGHPGLSFKPGQFAWVKIGTSPFAVREHPFSFSSSAMRADRLEISIKELGDFTSTIGTVAHGTTAYLDGPYGTFTTDRHRAAGYVFVAGGVGITPVMSILRTLADRRERKPLLLFYAGKTWEGMTFREELEQLTDALPLRVVYILEGAPDGWAGERGRINTEMMARYLPSDRMDYEYFVCGPEGMQVAVRDALVRLGLPLENVQSESFNFV
jgi:predicted ferric reductase